MGFIILLFCFYPFFYLQLKSHRKLLVCLNVKCTKCTVPVRRHSCTSCTVHSRPVLKTRVHLRDDFNPKKGSVRLSKNWRIYLELTFIYYTYNTHTYIYLPHLLNVFYTCIYHMYLPHVFTPWFHHTCIYHMVSPHLYLPQWFHHTCIYHIVTRTPHLYLPHCFTTPIFTTWFHHTYIYHMVSPHLYYTTCIVTGLVIVQCACTFFKAK